MVVDGVASRYPVRPDSHHQTWARERTTSDGLPYGRPEIVLLFEAKALRAKDDDDLAAVLPSLPLARRGWLADAVARAYGAGRPWLSRLAAQ